MRSSTEYHRETRMTEVTKERVITVLETILTEWTPDKYTIGEYAVTNKGVSSFSAGSTTACKWCLVGYAQRVTILHKYDYRVVDYTCDELLTTMARIGSYCNYVTEYSDMHGWAGSRALVEKTLQRLTK